MKATHRYAHMRTAVLFLLLCFLCSSCIGDGNISADGSTDDTTSGEITDTEAETEALLPAYTGTMELTLPDMSSTTVEARGQLLIAVDAGHGQKDVGVIGLLGDEDVYEATVNLSLALRLEQFLTEMGYKVLMIRRDDTAVLGQGGQDYHTDQEAAARREMAKDAGAALYISLHCNSAADAEAWGSRLYYNGETLVNFNGSPMATCYRTALNETFVGEIKSGQFCTVKQNYLNPMKEPYIVLKDRDMPAFLFEVGFMTNIQDFANLTDDNFLWKYAYAVAVGTDMARAEGRLG